MPTKQAIAALVRMLEEAIYDVGDLPKRRFYVNVADVRVSGSPPSKVEASVVWRFLPSGAPFCCGEPACYSHVFGSDGDEEVGEYLRRKMNLRQRVAVTLKWSVEYYDGIAFTAF